MARVTVEDCIDKVENRFDLVLLASHRARPCSFVLIPAAISTSDWRHVTQAKFWLNPTQLASSYGFSSRELNELERLVEQNEAVLLEAWNEHFGQH